MCVVLLLYFRTLGQTRQRPHKPRCSCLHAVVHYSLPMCTPLDGRTALAVGAAPLRAHPWPGQPFPVLVFEIANCHHHLASARACAPTRWSSCHCLRHTRLRRSWATTGRLDHRCHCTGQQVNNVPLQLGVVRDIKRGALDCRSSPSGSLISHCPHAYV